MAKNPNATNIGGEDFWPLNVDQRERFHKAATEADEPKEKLTGLTLLHTGLRNTGFCHMRSNWLETDQDGELRVVVPFEEVCTGGTGPTGKDNEQGENLHERGQPCNQCRSDTPDWVSNDLGKDDYHDEKWHPKSKAGGGRAIPIEEINEDATDHLKWWFDLNEEIPMMHNAVNNRIEKIAERANIDREVTAHDLRNTFATHLARQGVDQRYTADMMGHANVSSTDPYYKFVGADLKSELRDKLGSDDDTGLGN